MNMKTKKRKTLLANKSRKRQNDFGVKNYCEACLIIRTRKYNSQRASKRWCIAHTCNKSVSELNEFIYHMGMINLMRAKEVFE